MLPIVDRLLRRRSTCVCACGADCSAFCLLWAALTTRRGKPNSKQQLMMPNAYWVAQRQVILLICNVKHNSNRLEHKLNQSLTRRMPARICQGVARSVLCI